VGQYVYALIYHEQHSYVVQNVVQNVVIFIYDMSILKGFRIMI
jgi:hypothetical protein